MNNRVDENFYQIMMSNIRPKCEPIITASETKEDGTTIEFIWKAKDIKSMSLKQSIDPMGRELPYIELTWTEIYTGEGDFENSDKYVTTTPKMAVNLTIAQNLGFFNTWKLLYTNSVKWKQLYDNKKTWKQLRNDVEKKMIEYPILFLENKPEIKDRTITWKAKDFLSFLTEQFPYAINLKESTTSFYNPIRQALSLFYGTKDKPSSKFEEYTRVSMYTIQKLIENNYSDLSISSLYVDSDVKSFLKNYLDLENFYLIFGKDCLNIARFLELTEKENQTQIKINTMFKTPQKDKIPQISKYVYSVYGYDENGKWVQEYKSNGENYFRTLNNEGEEYNENNPLNSKHDILDTDLPYERTDKLKAYFNSSKVVLNFECLPHFEFNPNDIAEIQKSVFGDNEESKMCKALIVSSELTYNGVFRQKIIAHEI